MNGDYFQERGRDARFNVKLYIRKSDYGHEKMPSPAPGWLTSALSCMLMPDTLMAVARWVLPVPGPPPSTTLCALSVKAVLASIGDERTVHRRDLEVEACQVAMHREAGRVHLVADRAHRAVRGLGL